uniref:Uncharacterized protein n=1 Tax=Anguilla anguilla TaxID=7936 RepID=A0A0E9TD51_ANGAN
MKSAGGVLYVSSTQGKVVQGLYKSTNYTELFGNTIKLYS